MAVQFLFNSSGDWIAFRVDRWIFDVNSRSIGWLAWGDDDVATDSGDYLGTIFGDRLYRKTNWAYRGYPGYPGYSGYPGYPGYPGFAGYSPLQPGTVDVELKSR